MPNEEYVPKELYLELLAKFTESEYELEELKKHEQMLTDELDHLEEEASSFDNDYADLLSKLEENWELPSKETRPENYEALAFHRGKWRHVLWTSTGGWSLGRGAPFINEEGRKFAKLPPKPEGADGFFDWNS